ncbi:MAG: protein kinase [Acidobacteria bacterium]|nr:protein kinase [Acidobacteriota bacterium]
MPELKLENSLVDDRYAVRERLSWGSYAEIWVARDQVTAREVVLKTLNTSLQGTPDPDLERTLVENFQNEAIALDQVRHPHVILRMGHGTAADLRGVPFHYLVLEYMPGGDLAQWCRQQPHNRLPLERTLSYVQQACEALAFAHQQGIIHRDLKPNNFLLSGDHQTLKIADFGVAKLKAGDASEITRVGTNAYAPPEHHPDEKGNITRVERLTAAADIYSLAKTVYTILCGRTPSAFVCQPVTALADELKNELWATPLLKVLERATSHEPSARYASIIEFWSDLASVAALGNTAVDEETQVRPRLNVDAFNVPTRPDMPAFNPKLASSGAVAIAATATLEAVQPSTDAPEPTTPIAPKSNGHHAPVKDFGGRKFTVDLPHAAPVVAAPVAAVPAPKPVAVPKQQAVASLPAWRKALTPNVRRRLFPVLLTVALLGVIVTVFNQVRRNGVPVAFGQPGQIEVLREKLNVRVGPSQQTMVLGVVARDSRHRVIEGDEQGWLHIEVSQWDESEQHQNERQGWIYLPGNAKVTARRW